MTQEKENKRKPKKLPKIISAEQAERIFSTFNLNCPSGLRNYAAFRCAYRAGLRASEIINLSPEDIIWDKKKIYVQQGKSKKDRMVFIGDELLACLKKWAEIRPQSGYFFCTVSDGDERESGRPLSDSYLRQVLRRKSHEAGVYVNHNHEIKPVSPHILRHTYATWLLESGLNIRKVQQQLGHADLSATMLYTHVVDDGLAAEIQALG